MTTQTFHPYPNYKPSGIEWLGDVPTHWEVQRGKTLFQTVDVRSQTGNEELLTVSAERGIVPRKSVNVTMFKAESYVGYKLCWPGDLVINSLWAWAHALGISQYHGIVSSAYGVYRLLPKFKNYASFIHRLVRSIPFQWELQVRSKGIWISRLQLTNEAFLGAPFPLPPLAEQTAIVRYIDHIDELIRRYISAKEQLIGLLEEQRQAIIHRAVTRGLDPNVPLKPSGVEWLGDVPEHWEVRRLKHVFQRIVGGATPTSTNSNFWDGNVVWITPRDVSKTIRLQNSIRRITQKGLSSCSAKIVPPGSIIVTSRAPVGNVALAETELCTNQGCKTLVVAAEILNPIFGFNIMSILKDELQSLATGTTFTEIATSKLAAMYLPLPPLSEQTAIVRYLDKATADIDTVIDRNRRQIELLKEYRTRLTADVVTGKIDVRGDMYR